MSVKFFAIFAIYFKVFLTCWWFKTHLKYFWAKKKISLKIKKHFIIFYLFWSEISEYVIKNVVDKSWKGENFPSDFFLTMFFPYILFFINKIVIMVESNFAFEFFTEISFDFTVFRSLDLFDSIVLDQRIVLNIIR